MAFVNAWEIVEVLRFLTMWKNEMMAFKILFKVDGSVYLRRVDIHCHPK